MPNAAFSKGQRQAKIPISVTGPFPLKIGDKKPLLYGFGSMVTLGPKVTATTPKLKTSFNFGKLSLVSARIKRPSKIGVGRPISVSNIPGPRLGKVGILGR